MTEISQAGRILRAAFWRALGKPEEPGDVEWWNRVAQGAREAAAAAYKHGGMGTSIHAAACYFGREFWEHPDCASWKPRDQADFNADMPRFRAAAEALLTTLQRQGPAA